MAWVWAEAAPCSPCLRRRPAVPPRPRRPPSPSRGLLRWCLHRQLALSARPWRAGAACAPVGSLLPPGSSSWGQRYRRSPYGQRWT
eukprot:919446-Heterocapsa_arctica.AAC.3